MESTDSEKAIERIEFLINRLIDFSNENEYNFVTYKAFANESSITFNRYFTQIDNELDKEKIISDLKTDFHFMIDNVVTEILATINSPIKNFEPGVTYCIPQPKPDNRIICFESNYKQLIELFLNKISLEQPEAVKPDEKYKTQNLFKVGKLFATGEMNKYFTIKGNNEIVLNIGLSPLKIAKELGNPSFEKWILASKNNYKDGENKVKNIFNNLDMMTKIISDCEVENIPVEPFFINRLPIE